MGFAARFVLGLMAPLLGAGLGAGLGLLGGLAWTELTGTSSFEGYSGYVVAFWMLGGALVGLVAAPVLVFRWVKRRGAGGYGTER